LAIEPSGIHFFTTEKRYLFLDGKLPIL
jgi:hypothetical protein